MQTTTTSDRGLLKAVRIAGGQAGLAKSLNAGRNSSRKHVTQQAVSQWMRQGYAPVDRALEITSCVKNRVPPIELIDPELVSVMQKILSLSDMIERSQRAA